MRDWLDKYLKPQFQTIVTPPLFRAWALIYHALLLYAKASEIILFQKVLITGKISLIPQLLSQEAVSDAIQSIRAFLRDVCLQRSLHAHDAAALRCDEGGDETSDENARKFRVSCNTTTSSMITMLRTGLQARGIFQRMRFLTVVSRRILLQT